MLTRWNPITDLENALFNFSPRFYEDFWESKPLTDIHEDKENTYIDVDLPGVDIKDININIENDILSISGEYKREKKKYYRSERYCGSFKRSFIIDGADINKIEAASNKGVLKIKIPKKPNEIPKKIPIKLIS